jgi:hypothetical protein
MLLYATADLHHMTIADNASYGVHLILSTGESVTVRDSIVADNAASQFYKSVSGGSVTLDHNLVVGGTGGYGGTYAPSPGTGSFINTPLFVGGGNYRITSNSPARKAGSDGSDLGALPYTQNATIGLQGKLFVDTTLSGINDVLGDVTVAPGATLTLAPGAVLNFPANQDSMRGGLDPSRIELIAEGRLVSAGNGSNRVTLTSTSQLGWRGVRIARDAGSLVMLTDILNADFGVDFHAPGVLRDSVINIPGGANGIHVLNTGAIIDGVRVSGANAGLETDDNVSGSAGTISVTNSVFTGNGYGVYHLSGEPLAMSHTVVHGNTTRGVLLYASADLHHMTIADNASYGVQLSIGTGESVTVRDSIVANNVATQFYKGVSGGFVVFRHRSKPADAHLHHGEGMARRPLPGEPLLDALPREARQR